MREIKFRAWVYNYEHELFNMKMYPVSMIDFGEKLICVRDIYTDMYDNIMQDRRLDEDGFANYVLQYHECFLLEYSGVKDLMDNEIFEHDIVSYTINGKTKNGTVDFNDGFFHIIPNSGLAIELDEDNVDAYQISIVGNYYENHDLL